MHRNMKVGITKVSSRWRPARWLPSSASHGLLAEGPDGCSWSGNWCFDGWAEAVAGKQCPPCPRPCRWPGSCPADSASAGQSLPGEPPPGTRQRCLVEVYEEAMPDFLLPWNGRGRALLAPARKADSCVTVLWRRGGRGPQAIKDWRSRSRLLGWRHFRAGGFSILLVESHRQASHPVSLPDGTDTILKGLWIGTDHMAAFKRCRPHGRKNLGLELEVLQESISTQQLQVRRGRKACGHRGNLCFLNYGQLLPEKFRAFVLGRELFYHWCHHRVSQRSVDGGPPGQLFGV